MKSSDITDQLAQALEACHPSKVWEMARMNYTTGNSAMIAEWHEERCKQVDDAIAAYRASKEGEKASTDISREAAEGPFGPVRVERCCECNVLVSDWIDSDDSQGRICRPCEHNRSLLSATAALREENERLRQQLNSANQQQ